MFGDLIRPSGPSKIHSSLFYVRSNLHHINTFLSFARASKSPLHDCVFVMPERYSLQHKCVAGSIDMHDDIKKKKKKKKKHSFLLGMRGFNLSTFCIFGLFEWLLSNPSTLVSCWRFQIVSSGL